MADNVPLATGPLTVATRQDAAGAQHQEMLAEFAVGGQAAIPVAASTSTPLPINDELQLKLLTAILVELRVHTELLYSMQQLPVEPVEALRAKYDEYPVRIS